MKIYNKKGGFSGTGAKRIGVLMLIIALLAMGLFVNAELFFPTSNTMPGVGANTNTWGSNNTGNIINISTLLQNLYNSQYTNANLSSQLDNNTIIRTGNLSTIKVGNATYSDSTSSISCTDITGSPDTDFCTDDDSGAGGSYVLNVSADANQEINIQNSEVFNISGDTDGNITTTATGNILRVLFDVGKLRTYLDNVYQASGSFVTQATQWQLANFTAVFNTRETSLFKNANWTALYGVQEAFQFKIANGTALAVGGDASGTVGAIVVTDDSHAHTTTTISGLLSADMGDEDWGDGTFSSNSFSIDSGVIGQVKLTDNGVGFQDANHTLTLAGNPALAASQCYWASTGIICEGSTANTIETLLTFTNPTSDRTITFSDSSITVAGLASAMTGTFDGNNFGGGAIGQGDILYGSAAGTISELAKDTSATRYISNTGSSNNPAWGQVNLANGVTGTLPVANGGTGATALTFLTNNTDAKLKHLNVTTNITLQSSTGAGLIWHNGSGICIGSC